VIAADRRIPWTCSCERYNVRWLLLGREGMAGTCGVYSRDKEGGGDQHHGPRQH
jgi:hypothetical protein